MTVGVAVEAPGGVWVACDSALSIGEGDGAYEQRTSGPKWLPVPGGLVLHAGSLSPIAWLRSLPRSRPKGAAAGFRHALPQAPQAVSERWLVERWTPLLRKAHEHAAEWFPKDAAPDWSLIFAVRGESWTWSADDGAFARAPVATIGCGDTVAQGALAALADRPARERVTRAVEAACDLVAGVRAPVHVRWVPRKEAK